MSELGPPPAPKPVQMPPMPAHFAASPAPGGGQPMMMGGGCHPSIGGMGPNLVFNFGSPYGMGYPCVAAPIAEEKEEPKEEEKKPSTIIVQGDPTWCQPRLIEKKGKKVKDEPCLIM